MHKVYTLLEIWTLPKNKPIGSVTNFCGFEQGGLDKN